MPNSLQQAIYLQLKDISANGEYMALMKAFQNAFNPFVLINPRTMADRLVDMLERMAKEAAARGEKLDGFSQET